MARRILPDRFVSGVLLAAAAPAWCAADQPAGDAPTFESLALAVLASPHNVPGWRHGARSSDERPATVEPDADEPSDEDRGPWWTWDRATGDWWGARPALEDRGITIESSYALDWTSVWSGGAANRASTRSLFDVNVGFDLEKLIALPGGTVFIDFYSYNGRGGADPGDFQGYSVIDAGRNANQIAELWYEQWLAGDRLRLKVGKIEANGEFAWPESGAEFINTSAAISPTILALPTYPDPATGIVLFFYPNEQTYIGGGFFDGAATVDGVMTGARGPGTFFNDRRSDDYFMVTEAGRTWDALGSLGSGRAAAGAWHHTGSFDTLDGRTDNGTTGFYAIIEQQLTRRAVEDDDDGGLWAFLQYGYADADISEVKHHVGAGLATFGTFADRDDDSAGIYVSAVDLSDSMGHELVFETYYRLQVTPFFAVKPNLQYIVSPSGNSGIGDALVGGLRVEVEF